MSARLGLWQDQPALLLRSPDGARAVVLLHGGHVVSWVPAGGEEQLYLSPTSRLGGEGVAVRGGVPVIFPQFNQRGPLPKHGLARTRPWALGEAVVRGSHAIGVLRLTDDASTHAVWPQGFALELTVSLAGRELELELAVENTGTTAFSFTAALHTYLRCNDVEKAQLEGLQGRDYEDMVLGRQGQQWNDVLTVVGELDRVYHQTQGPLTLREMGRRLGITQRGFEDVVTWNPGPERCAALPDMPDDGWRQMLCVEAACIAHPVTLAPGQDWIGLQSLHA